MVTDGEVRRLVELLGKGMSLTAAAAKADMDEKTARKYRSMGKMPHELRGSILTVRVRSEPQAEKKGTTLTAQGMSRSVTMTELQRWKQGYGFGRL